MATPREIVSLEQQLEAAMMLKLDAEKRHEEAIERLEETRNKLISGTDRLDKAATRVQGLRHKIQDVNSQIAGLEYRRKLRADLKKAQEQAAAKPALPRQSGRQRGPMPQQQNTGPICSIQYEMAMLGADLLREAARNSNPPRK